MNWHSVLKSIDALVFEKTGRHLSSLQVDILSGVLNNQKYNEIAEKYGCTMGHVKDEGYELWKILSEVLGEELNKSNFRATVERLGFTNSQYQIVGNPVQIGHLNLCRNLTSAELDDLETTTESNSTNASPLEQDDKVVLQDKQLKMIKKLVQLGLTIEQIADVINLSLNEVQEVIEK